MKRLKFVPISFALLLTAHLAHGQGCSDAGVCSLNSFKPAETGAAATKGHFKIGLNNGLADYDINVLGGYVEYGHRFSDRLGLDAKLAFIGQSGNEVSAFGPSDIYLNGNYAFGEKTALTLGAKIPLSQADKSKDGLALPMDYQSSLGTLDLILGISHRIQKLHLVLAIQQPLTDNGNRFLAEAYPSNSVLNGIQSTNQFERRGDVLLRVSYPVKFGEKLRITPSILPIYHLGKDRYVDGAGVQRDIEGSDGLTLNGNVYVDYALGEKGNLQLSLASPFLVREVRPDGLTRGYVVGLEYGVRF